MLNINIKSLVFICFLSMLSAQSVSMRQIEQLSNNQIDAIKEGFKSDSIAEEQIENQLVNINLAPKEKKESSENFGYSYFQQSVSFFDNIPAPSEFKIGPGDELLLSLWGETNLRKKFVINKDGSFFYENIGFINLNNKTLQEAESILLNRLSEIYSTINNEKNLTKLSLELGKLKSINVYFTGETNNPGINLIHPFSDIFTALSQTGLKETGSLRNVQLIREGEIVDTFDFYTFFINGKNNFSKVRIFDGDIIHIPVIANRVQIQGGTTRLGYFELIDTDTVSDLFKYAGGLKAIVSDTIIVDRVIPADQRTSNDNARSRGIIPISEASNSFLNNGDWISIPAITAVETDATIYGNVKNSGGYPARNMTLKDVLKLAGGFDDPLYRQSLHDDIVILRKDKNNFYSSEFVENYSTSDTFILEPGDKIFVYENIKYNNDFLYRVEGQVFKPGTYPLKQKSITVREALSLAGGLTELSTEKHITVKQQYSSMDNDGNLTTSIEVVNNVSLDFELGSGSVLIAAPVENVVNIVGNVYNPGLVTYTKNLRYPKYIELAGGYKPDTMKRNIYIQRANGNIKKIGGYFMSRRERIYAGDSIIVPINETPSDFDVSAFTVDMLSLLTNLVAILAIVDNTSD